MWLRQKNLQACPKNQKNALENNIIANILEQRHTGKLKLSGR